MNKVIEYKVEVAIPNKHGDKKSLKKFICDSLIATYFVLQFPFLAVCKNIYKIEVVVFPCLQT